MRLYTKALMSIDEGDLRNHVSYWLVMQTLMEQGLIDEIDQEYLDLMEGMGEVPLEPFFLQESSLKLMCRYFKKLNQWHHDTIYLFYFQLLNLYYWYDPAATSRELHKQLNATSIDFTNLVTKLYCKDFKMAPSFTDINPII